ncbi:MAG: hypothetical protein FWE11_02870 [Defluviitaleaceae bacterium]|nr:hypothetical protein [Defluviitaleaceae bacterium]
MITHKNKKWRLVQTVLGATSKTIVTLVIVMILLAGCGSSNEEEVIPARELPEQIEMFFFYDELCLSCVDESEFFELFHEEVGDVAYRYPYRLIPVNVARTGGRSIFNETMASFGHSTDSIEFPLMMVASRLFQGEENIRRNIREAFLVAGEDIFVNEYVFNSLYEPTPMDVRHNIEAGHNTIIYFYRIVCPGCIELEPFLDSLPDAVLAYGDDIPVNIIRINTRSGNNGDMIRAFFSYFNVPDDEQFVPIVFLRDTHLTGNDMIREGLLELLAEGAGLDFAFPPFPLD